MYGSARRRRGEVREKIFGNVDVSSAFHCSPGSPPLVRRTLVQDRFFGVLELLTCSRVERKRTKVFRSSLSLHSRVALRSAFDYHLRRFRPVLYICRLDSLYFLHIRVCQRFAFWSIDVFFEYAKRICDRQSLYSEFFVFFFCSTRNSNTSFETNRTIAFIRNTNID